jgi:hypothetical protein
MGGWAGLRTGQDAVENRNIYVPYKKSNPDSSIIQPII